MITKNKVLIIKLGHSETLDPIISKECSLGDVVRTTVILNYFRRPDSVTWLVDEKAAAILEDNPGIDRVLLWNWENAIQLQRENFDIIINLEKGPSICALSDSIYAYRRCGFRFSEWKASAEAHYNTEKVLEIALNPDKRDTNTKYWQQHLAKVIDRNWSSKDKYVMKRPLMEPGIDVGLNWIVGKKWPEKAWPFPKWKELQEKLIKSGMSVSIQPQLSLEIYLHWISSCNNVITCDSLGMHLGIAYNIPTIALFGPTPHKEVFMYDNGEKIVSKTGKMDAITVDEVFEVFMRRLSGSKKT